MHQHTPAASTLRNPPSEAFQQVDQVSGLVVCLNRLFRGSCGLLACCRVRVRAARWPGLNRNLWQAVGAIAGEAGDQVQRLGDRCVAAVQIHHCTVLQQQHAALVTPPMHTQREPQLEAGGVEVGLDLGRVCDILCKESSAIRRGWCVEMYPEVAAVVLVIGTGDPVRGPTKMLSCVERSAEGCYSSCVHVERDGLGESVRPNQRRSECQKSAQVACDMSITNRAVDRRVLVGVVGSVHQRMALRVVTQIQRTERCQLGIVDCGHGLAPCRRCQTEGDGVLLWCVLP
jgi:hypothetical protein